MYICEYGYANVFINTKSHRDANNGVYNQLN